MTVRGRAIGAIVVVVGAGLLTASAVAAPVEDRPIGHYSTPAMVAAMPTTSVSTYLVTMRGLIAGQERTNQTDAELIASGQEVCTNEVAKGLTWVTLAEIVDQYDLSLPFYRAYVQAAVSAFCPSAFPGMG